MSHSRDQQRSRQERQTGSGPKVKRMIAAMATGSENQKREKRLLKVGLRRQVYATRACTLPLRTDPATVQAQQAITPGAIEYTPKASGGRIPEGAGPSHRTPTKLQNKNKSTRCGLSSEPNLGP